MNKKDLFKKKIQEKKKGKKTNLPQNKVNTFISSVDKEVKCGPQCQKMQREQNLKRLYTEAVTNYTQGPTKIKLAEKNYYEATKGSAYYNEMLKEKYSKEIKEISAKNVAQHKDNVKEINTKIDAYTSETIYNRKMKTFLDRLMSENLTLKEQHETNKSLIYTNDRKTFYEDQQIQNIYYWRRVVVALFWILFISLCINVLFLKKKYDDYKAWIRLFIIALFPNYVIPFIQKIILKIYYLLLKAKDSMKIKNVYIDLK